MQSKNPCRQCDQPRKKGIRIKLSQLGPKAVPLPSLQETSQENKMDEIRPRHRKSESVVPTSLRRLGSIIECAFRLSVSLEKCYINVLP